ncbi:hypothetical protein MN032_01700 [Agromyces atrinae]|uniref:hypothetical protein n=1 Tax=Agromyces atrinae TaxID=592376 RepID=UPI001F590DCA|nr:hypothetical protein [Agromyces atrinae]MCI2956392.1 hypothetical protein [Agromyces atrinae]
MRSPAHTPSRRRSIGSRLGALVATLALGAGIAVAAPTAAWAAPSVSVTVEGRADLQNVADPEYLTELRLTGSGFQSIQGGHGGIYVGFGWVSGDGWRPSSGGITGQDYRYVPDDESNPVGYLLFVTFPGSDTAYAANGGEVAADGSWSSTISVPGARFESYDREGKPTAVDCLEVQCGIITFGAHGVKNANNETFTPIDFRGLYGEDDGAAAAPVEGTDAGAATAPDAAAAPVATAAPTATPTPTPTTLSRTVYEEASGDTEAAAAQQQLVQTMMWVVIGIGVIAVAALAFLVWAVVSGRRRARAVPVPAGPTPETDDAA